MFFLYNLKFSMVIANLKKTFNKFLVRFTLAITLLDFTNRYKISNFQKTFNKHFYFKIVDSIIYTLFS